MMSEVFASFPDLVLYFALYSFYGWICETLYCSFYEKRYVSRGFLSGPYCPIYGTGALIILGISLPLAVSPLLVFCVTLLVASVLEYFTSWVFETLFQLRLWDYSNQKWNIKGRVCLLNAILFGLLGLAAVYAAHPLSKSFVEALRPEVRGFLSSSLVIVFAVDFLHSVAVVSGLNERLRELQQFLEETGAYQKKNAWLDCKDLAGSAERLREICLKDAGDLWADNALVKLDLLLAVRDRSYRLVRNYPTLMPRSELASEFAALRKAWADGMERLSLKAAEGRAKKTGLFSSMKTGVRKIDPYELFWLFIAGSALGYFGRTVLYMLQTGQLGGGQGLIYGPFAPIFGVGAVLAALSAGRPPAQKDGRVFIVCALLGGLLEFLAFRLEGKMLGMHFWGYGRELLSFESFGIPSMLTWGCLGKLLVERTYPTLLVFLKRLSQRQKIVLTAMLALFIAFDVLISATAVSRWRARYDGVPAESGWQQFLDGRYPDEELGKIFPGVRFAAPKQG